MMRTALAIVAGGTTFWLVQWLSMPLIALIPGLEQQVAEWLSVVRPNPHEIGRFAISVLLAGLLELARRYTYKGRNVTFAFAMMMLLVSIDTRAAETPQLRFLVGLWAAFRFAGIYAAAGVMALVTRRVAAPEPKATLDEPVY